MNKTSTCTLALLMTLSLAACSTKTPQQDPVGSIHTEENVEKDEDTTAFDTSWAENDFEAMIPQPPFSGWTVTNQTDTVYEIETGGLSTADGADTASGYEADKDKLISYLHSLPSYGFTVEETGDNYMWVVTDANGNTIEFTCGDGYCWVVFTKA